MTYHLPPDVSFGMLGERAVVLDLRVDRYFLIGTEEATALLTAGAGRKDPLASRCLHALERRRLIDAGVGGRIEPVVAEPLRRSALEVDAGRGDTRWPEIALFRAEAGICLRLLGLRRTLIRWKTLRRRYEIQRNPEHGERDAIAVAQGFAEARILLPASTLCVPDSLTLARALWRRGIDAEVYFGVRLAPFLAHAWVQRGDLLLSDTLNTVGEYTPVFRL